MPMMWLLAGKCCRNPRAQFCTRTSRHPLLIGGSLQIRNSESAPSDSRPSVEEIARQIALRDWSWWAKLNPVEFFGLGWTKARKNETSPNSTACSNSLRVPLSLQRLTPTVIALSKWFNTLSGWVVHATCTCENLKDRIKVGSNLSSSLHFISFGGDAEGRDDC